MAQVLLRKKASSGKCSGIEGGGNHERHKKARKEENMQNPNLIQKALWRTEGNQHRIIFEVRDGKVYYGSRGGNIENKFTQGEECKVDRFLNDCGYERMFEDVEWERARNDLIKWIQSNNI